MTLISVDELNEWRTKCSRANDIVGDVMDVLTVLSSLGLGAFLGAVANRMLDALQERRRQRFELQRKLFDLKVDTTLRCLRAMKYGTDVFRAATKRLEEVLAMSFSKETSAAISSSLATELERATKGLEALTNESLGADSLLSFFYGERLSEILGRQETHLQAIRLIMFGIFDEMEKITGELHRIKDLPDDANTEIKAAIKAEILALLRRFVALRHNAEELSTRAGGGDV
jgi:hypothetical protein